MKNVLALRYTSSKALWDTAVSHLRAWLAHKLTGVQTTTITWDIPMDTLVRVVEPSTERMLRELACVDEETLAKLLRAEDTVIAGAPAMRALRAWQQAGAPLHIVNAVSK